MAKSKPKGSRKGEGVDSGPGIERKPGNHRPSKAELEEDLRLPASFDRTVKALFAGDKKRREVENRGLSRKE